jgi:cobyrinic acid a,c-diamide synthase
VVIPRVVVAGTHSGCGKTTVATGLMAALAAKGLRVAGFKVGPDFIDPSYHAVACGRPGRNLDAFLSGPDLIGPLFAHGAEACDIAVVEGVMGLYDGRAGAGEEASTAQVAKLLQAPVLLVVDARSMARSAAAVVLGFRDFDPGVEIAGVIFNGVGSDRHEAMLREALEPAGVPVAGVVRRMPELELEARHLGLVPVVEAPARIARAIERLGTLAGSSLDLGLILGVAQAAAPLPCAAWDPGSPAGPPRAVVAVAAGPAFSFVYRENLELLRAAGAHLAFFDPGMDEALPDGTGAIYLGGGFPEVHAGALSANMPMRAAIHAFAGAGGPVVAECGGLLYLCRSLDGAPMCGLVDAEAVMTSRLSLGYRTATAAGSWLFEAGVPVRAHEFHYGAVKPAAGASPAWRMGGRDEGFVQPGVHASFLHGHWAATPGVARRLVDRARKRAA